MTLWVLAFIAEMLEVKGTLYFFDTFMEKRDGGYRNRYRFFVYCECFTWQQSQEYGSEC